MSVCRSFGERGAQYGGGSLEIRFTPLFRDGPSDNISSLTAQNTHTHNIQIHHHKRVVEDCHQCYFSISHFMCFCHSISIIYNIYYYSTYYDFELAFIFIFSYFILIVFLCALSFFITFSITYVVLYNFLIFLIIFMHLADAFIQSDLQCIQVIRVLSVCVCSLGIEPTTFCTANAML